MGICFVTTVSKRILNQETGRVHWTGLNLVIRMSLKYIWNSHELLTLNKYFDARNNEELNQKVNRLFGGCFWMYWPYLKLVVIIILIHKLMFQAN